PVFAYGSQTPHNEMAMPDGIGVQLGAAQPVMVQLHYINTTQATLTAQVNLEIEPFDPGVAYTPANVFFTFNTHIAIPPMGTAKASGSCDVPKGAHFFAMTTHSHKYTVEDQVHDGSTLLVDTKDYAHPTVTEWMTAPNYEFTSGKLDYSCSYSNPTSNFITV